MKPDPVQPLKIAVITPYCYEDIGKLRRCHESVLSQADKCTHFLIADGEPKMELSTWDCRHICLGISHRDNGNTPRGIGGILAMNEGYDVVMYLDADNWYEPLHTRSVLQTHFLTSSDVIFSSRHIALLDGSIVDGDDPEDVQKLHVDTSCMSIFPNAYRALAHWCLMPQSLGPICDRAMLSLLQSEFTCAWTNYKSVFFESSYAGHYRMAGKEVPPNAKGIELISYEFTEAVIHEHASRAYRCLQHEIDCNCSGGDERVGVSIAALQVS